MKRVIVLASGLATALALTTPTLADNRGKLIYEDITESKYVSEKNVRVIAKKQTSEPGGKSEPQKVTELTTDTYEVGTRVWQKPSGLCHMEKRTLKGIEEFSGVQFPSIHVKSGAANCETREFLKDSDFPS